MQDISSITVIIQDTGVSEAAFSYDANENTSLAKCKGVADHVPDGVGMEDQAARVPVYRAEADGNRFKPKQGGVVGLVEGVLPCGCSAAPHGHTNQCPKPVPQIPAPDAGTPGAAPKAGAALLSCSVPQ